MSSITDWISSPRSPYEVLGVAQEANPEAIRKAHRKLALKHHPDRIKDSSLVEENKKEFDKIQQAYELLIDPERRQRYDELVKIEELKREKSEEVQRKANADKSANAQASWDEYFALSSAGFRPTDPNNSKFEGLKGYLNGSPVYAVADTGADGNFIAKHAALSAQMKLKMFSNSNRPSFLMAHGKTVRPIAKARAVWKFARGTDEKYVLSFFVLQDCIFDVMLGAKFVYGAELFSTNRHLFTSFARPDNSVHIRLVKTCGSPQQHLKGTIRHTRNASMDWVDRCSALPDSASEPNLVSYTYAAKRGWLPYLRPSPPSCRLLQFVDGSIEEIYGWIPLFWRFDRHPRHTALTNLGAKSHTAMELQSVDRHVRNYVLAAEGPYSSTMRPKPARRNAMLLPTTDRRPRRQDPSHVRSYANERIYNLDTIDGPEMTGSVQTGPFVFCVLRNCPWNVIVGHNFLGATNAFTDQAHCFRPVFDESLKGLNPVIWADARKRKEKQTVNATMNVLTAPDAATQLNDELEALALQFDKDKGLKRKKKYTILRPEAVPDSASTTTTQTQSSTSSTSGLRL